MILRHTENLLKQMGENQKFDSYAVYVRIGNEQKTIYSEKVNEDTYFDIASCGKVLVTSPLILQAIDRGLLDLNSTLDDFFDEVPEEKKKITVRQLLSHTSGIIRINFDDEMKGKKREDFIKAILEPPLAFLPDTDYVYSCNGMILLGYILEIIYKKSLEEIFEENLKKPLGYTRSKFNIEVDEPNMAICYRSKDVKGLSHPWDDENVRVLQTSAGSGGQFFTMSDIKKYTDAIMSRDPRLYSEKMFELAEKNYAPDCAEELRGLGWLYIDKRFKQTGKLFPEGSFGHEGFCGQSINFNREKEMCVVILTNATRFEFKRHNFEYGDYENIKKMREILHNEIHRDLIEEELL